MKMCNVLVLSVMVMFSLAGLIAGDSDFDELIQRRERNLQTLQQRLEHPAISGLSKEAREELLRQIKDTEDLIEYYKSVKDMEPASSFSERWKMANIPGKALLLPLLTYGFYKAASIASQAQQEVAGCYEDDALAGQCINTLAFTVYEEVKNCLALSDSTKVLASLAPVFNSCTQVLSSMLVIPIAKKAAAKAMSAVHRD
ncbi:hypothetical protein FJ365_01925 [Candidatus Dependentiae bacterium]|nr:hypothetical protein [Candidatus Dependentiae bacterium]